MKVEIENYNPEWNEKFNNLKNEIISLDNEGIIKTIEHIGSTSVKGLGAKPVIDIMIGVEEDDDLDLLPELFDRPGYNYKKIYEVSLPFRRFFTQTVDINKIANIHCVKYDHVFRTEDIIFRDYLRNNSKVRDEYFGQKLELASYDWETVNHYADAKTDFISKKKKEAASFFMHRGENAELEALNEIFESIPAETKERFGIKNRRYKKALLLNSGTIPTLIFNRVLYPGTHNYITSKDITYISNYYDKVNKFIIQLSPASKPEQLEKLLLKKQYREYNIVERFHKFTERSEYDDEDISVREVNNDEKNIFSSILRIVFEANPNVENILNSCIDGENWKCYFALYKGEIAGCAAMYLCDDTAWFEVAATLPEYRYKGIHKAMLRARENSAYENGCKWIAVETNSIDKDEQNNSYHNLLKSGFVRLYRRKNYILEKKNGN